MFSSVKSRLAAAAVAALLISGGVANAASLVNVEVLGSADGGATWSQSLTNVAANSSILFEVVGVESAIGTNYTFGSTNITINSQGTGDGFGSMSYNLTDSDGGAISSVALQNGYNGGNGPSAGTISGTGTTLTGARPILSTTALDTFTVFETGTLTVGSLGSTETLTPTFGGTTSGAKVNTTNGVGGNSLVLNTTSLNNGEWSLSGLTIAAETSPVPSPAVIPAGATLLSLAGIAALRRRFNAIA